MKKLSNLSHIKSKLDKSVIILSIVFSLFVFLPIWDSFAEDDLLIGHHTGIDDMIGQDVDVLGEPKAIPDWVKTQFEWYVSGVINEQTLLTSMNWLFDNNIMHLSENAAQEVHDLREKVVEQEAAISSLRTLVSSQAMSDESGEYWFDDLPPGYSENGERIMQPEYGGGASDNSVISVIAAVEVPSTSGVPYKIFVVGGEKKDINTLVQYVIRESHMDTNEDLQYYADKVRYYNDLKNAVLEENRMSKEMVAHELTHTIQQGTDSASGSDADELGRIKVQFPWMTADYDFASEIVGDILRKGGTASAWEEGIAAFSEHGNTESVIPELQGIVVLCIYEIDKKTQSINAELEIIESWLEIISEKQQSDSYDASGRLTSDTTTESKTQNYESDLNFITRNLSGIDQEIKALNTGAEVLDNLIEPIESDLRQVGDDAQLVNIDLQNALQKQQQTLQTLSNVSKMLHDTSMSIIRNMK